MKKIKNKRIEQNNTKTSLTEGKDNNFLQNLFKNNNVPTDYSSSISNSSHKFLNENKTLINFKKNKLRGPVYSLSKEPKFTKTSYNFTNHLFNIKTINTLDNKNISNIHKNIPEIFPYINLTKNDIKQKVYFSRSNDLNNFKRNNTIEKTNDRIYNIKGNFNQAETPDGKIPEDLKRLDASKFKYSIILKNLDIWDKDHCEENKKDDNAYLFNILYNYYEENKLENEKNDLIYASNIMKIRQNQNYAINEAKQENKELMEIIKRRKKETGTILKNNLYKTQLKFGELFDKKYTKAFDQDLDIDPDTFNLLLEDEIKSIFYNQIIKDRMKYEKQLHDGLLKINNILLKSKTTKDEKTLKLKELYIELTKLNREYKEKYTKNRNSYWLRYDNYEHYYKNLMVKNNDFGGLNKVSDFDDFQDNNLFFKKIFVEEKKDISKSPIPKKRRSTILDKNTLSIYKNHMKRLEDEKKFKLLLMNNEMNSKLREIENIYTNKKDNIISEQKKIEDDLKIHKLEINYFKKINDELVREHKVYYMNKLKKGYDCRKEGLTWVVYNLQELQVPLEYHHFPKYLTHEQIDYLKKYAEIELRQDQLKIIINTLKKKQNTQKMKDVLKMMNVIDNIIDIDNNYNNSEINEEIEYYNKDLLSSKLKIYKKFLKIYQGNIDVTKNYMFKNVESHELQKVINEFKKDLYHGSNSDINKSKRDVLNVFMGDKNNKNFFTFLVEIKNNLERLEVEKEKLFENQKKSYLKLVAKNMNHKASIDNVVKNEMIKRCLFGTRLDL